MSKYLAGSVGAGIAAAGLLLVGVGAARADTIWTATASGLSGTDPVSASATIDVGVGTMQITLSDTKTGEHTIGQEVSGILITLTDTVGNVTLTSQSGPLVDIAMSGAVTPVAGSPTHWGSNGSSNSKVIGVATAGSYAQGGKPVDLIVGPPPEVAGDGTMAHAPSISQTGVFALNVGALTPQESIKAVTFLFGTKPDASIGSLTLTNTGTGTGSQSAPEPASLVLLGSGLLGLGLLRRRKAKQG